MRLAGALVFCLITGTAIAQVEVENAWSRATPGAAKVAAGYMTLRNKGAAADRLVSASSPAAERVETHVHVKDGEVMRMREVSGYEIPAKGSFELKPGGAHLMLMNIKAPFKDGDRVPLTLKFERGGEVKVELIVGKAGASKHRHH